MLPLSMVSYGSTHGWVAAATLLAAAAVVSAGPLVARYPLASRRVAASALLLVWLVTELWHARPGQWRLDRSLPLHLCDVVGFSAFVAVAFRAAWARAILHHWAWCLCFLAYLAPAVREEPADVRFWTYWLSHAAILLAAVGDMTLGDYRPNGRTLRTALAGLGLYAWVVFPFNALFHTNYGYIGPVASQSRAMLQRLGDWPGRVAWLELIVVAAMAGLTVLLRRREVDSSQPRSVEPITPHGELLVDSYRFPRPLPQPRPLAA
jgi:hypothetical integral membrane protein (TIGR02206 family)